MKKNVGNIIRQIVMKMSIVCVVSCLTLVQSYAGFSQADATLSLDLKNASLKQVFEEIEKQSDYIIYYTELADVENRVSIQAVNASIEEILTKVLPAGHSFRQNGRQIAITVNQQPPSPMSVRATVSRMVTITGRVTDPNGNPVIGATVILLGTTDGTATDATGNYSLHILEGTAPESIISFSYVGKKTQEVRYQNRSEINVVLADDATQIEDVVVTGIANIQRRDMVGSYTAMTMDSIYNPSMTSLDQMLQGQVAGLQIVTTTNRAGAKSEIRLRGQSTLLGTTAPLWVIDGVVQTDMPDIDGMASDWNTGDVEINQYVGSAISWLNPQDIENITVLKDASATAIYGSRASNGVIVITTKRGQGNIDGRPNINVSANTTIGQRPNYSHYNLMNSQERIQFSKEATETAYYQAAPLNQIYTYEGLYNMYLNGDITSEQFADQYKFLETNNTNWLEMLMRTSVTQNYNLSLSGGGERTNYTASMSYSKVDASEKGNGTDRMTGRVTFGTDITPKLRVDISLIAGNTVTKGFAAGVNPLSYALNTSRAIPAYDQNGDDVWYKVTDYYQYNGDTQLNGLPYNFLNDYNSTGSKVTSPNYSANIDLKYKIHPDLTYQMVAGYSVNTRKSEQWADENSHHVVRLFRGYHLNTEEALNTNYQNAAFMERGGQLITDDSYQRVWSIRNQLNYFKQFNQDHRMTLTAMWEVSSTYYNSKYNTVWGYMRDRGEKIATPKNYTEVVPYNPTGSNPSNNDMYGKLTSGSWRSRQYDDNKMSLAVIGTYSFKDRYVVNANFRNDWSNAFGQDASQRFVPAYSVGISWKLLAEPFMQDRLKWMDAIIPRITYGTQGNQISQTPDMTLQIQGTNTLYNELASSIVKLATPNLTWERTKTWNFGIDLSAWGGRVTVVIDGYTKTSDVGRQLRLPAEYANFSTVINGSIMRNSGIEGTVNVVAFRNKDWNVSLGANFGRNWNKVIKMKQDEAEQRRYTNYLSGTTTLMLAEGYALGSLWAYSFAGLNDADGLPTFNYLDKNDITSPMDYLVYVGNSQHYLSGGMHLKVRYKSLSMTAQFNALVGGKAFLNNPYSTFASGRIPGPTVNLSKELNDRWRQPGDQTDIPGLYPYASGANYLSLDPITGNSTDIYNMWARSDARVASKSTLECSAVSFSYYLPALKLEALGIKGLTVTGAVNNLFMIADKKWKGMDPNMGGTERKPLSFTFGLNLGF